MATDSQPMGAQKPALDRPRWWTFARVSGLGWREHAATLTQRGTKVSHTQLWLMALPVDDPKRVMPSEDMKAALQAYTGGFVNALTDWPPLLARSEEAAA